MDYTTFDFDYLLPEKLIAQEPEKRRDQSRLLVLDRKSGNITHTYFNQIGNYLRPEDLLVMNNSKVFPARLYGEKELTAGKIEILLIKSLGSNIWQVIGKGLKEGARIRFSHKLLGSVLERDDKTFKMLFNLGGENFYQELENVGETPLPPYIRKKMNGSQGSSDYHKMRYQTVYAKERGSVAAPTAGLHFTQELLGDLKKRGIETAELTLHVGLGTFMPIKTNEISEHKMHAEHYAISAELIERIARIKKDGSRVIAVGTTTTRVLETIFADEPKVNSANTGIVSGDTEIFIRPPYQFRAIDGLITNFHLPKSTLLMLVASLAGKKELEQAYAEAISRGYRFYSYGDAMLVI